MFPTPLDDLPSDRGRSGDKANPWPRLLRELLKAAGMTVFLAVASFPLAMLVGMLIGVGRVYGPGWMQVPARGLTSRCSAARRSCCSSTSCSSCCRSSYPRSRSTRSTAGILGLAINYSAYEAENYRAGLLAIPKGQMEAALALGMNPFTAIRTVIVPQAFRIVIPPVTNDFIALFKDTSVCSVILITELTRKYNELYNFNRDLIVELAFITAGLYLLMSYPLSLLARWLERRMGTHAAGRPPMIRVTNLVKYHGAIRILDGATLEIRKGQVAALVGPSGGGKSTLLRCINGLEQFQEGEVAVGDIRQAHGWRPRRRRRHCCNSAERSGWCSSSSICSRT